MRKLNGITINGEYLGNSVVINAMFRAICTISPSVMREFIQIINKVDSLDEAVKISNFNCVNDSIDIEFGNKNQKGSASLSFSMKDGKPQLSDCKLAVGDEVYNSLSEFQDMVRAKEEKRAKLREKKRQKKHEELKAKRREELLTEKKEQILPQKIAIKDEDGNEIILEGKAAEVYFQENAERLNEDSDFDILDEDYFKQVAAIEEDVATQMENEDFEEELNALEEMGEFNDHSDDNEEDSDSLDDENNEEEENDSDSLNNASYDDSETDELSTSDSYIDNDTDSFENEESNSSEDEEVSDKSNDADISLNTNKRKDLTIDVDDSDEDNDLEFIKEAMDREGWDASDITKVNKCTIIAKSIKIEAAGFETNGNVMRPSAQQNLSNAMSISASAEFIPDSAPAANQALQNSNININNQFSQTSQGYGESQYVGGSLQASGMPNYSPGGMMPPGGYGPQQPGGYSQGGMMPPGGYGPQQPGGYPQGGMMPPGGYGPQQPGGYPQGGMMPPGGYGPQQPGGYPQGGMMPYMQMMMHPGGYQFGPMSQWDDPVRKQMEAIQLELERLRNESQSKKLTTLDEFMTSHKQLEAAKEKKRRERFRIVGSREHIRANALDGGFYVAGKSIYKWGETRTLDS